MGGFDDFFFAHQEEIDLCWRIQLTGYLVYSCPVSVVYHVGGGTLPHGNSLKTFLNFRNNRIMLSKNLPFLKKIWVMPMRLGLDTISALKGLFGGDPGYFKAVMRAEWAFIKWWMFNRKGSKSPLNKRGGLKGYWSGNIAWQHFVRKKRYFSEIVGKTN
jgi:GT2 family glycosyltransferase